MTLDLVQAAVVGENGHILASDGKVEWVVVVTREALEAVTHEYDVTAERLVKHKKILLMLAQTHLSDGNISGRDQIWVYEKDVLTWIAAGKSKVRSRQRHGTRIDAADIAVARSTRSAGPTWAARRDLLASARTTNAAK